MSKLLFWEVWNFMAIEHGKVEFDERNIVNLKGYNDSGKSAMLNALKVLLYNANMTKQVDFIQDDKDYFRILAVFDDGVHILRDKYKNGQSLYELYKDNKLLYTTKDKTTGALTKVSEVPKVIADYLGLITYDTICLNARSCFEKQIGVETSGSENYKMFNTVLKSEELASAASMLNNDKNKLVSEINSVESRLTANRELLGMGQYLSAGLIEELKSMDSDLDKSNIKQESLRGIIDTNSKKNSIRISPSLEEIELSRLESLEGIANIVSEKRDIKITPEVDNISNDSVERLELLEDISSNYQQRDNIQVSPKLDLLDDERLDRISELLKTKEGISKVNVPPEMNLVSDEKITILEVISDTLKTIEEMQKRCDSVDEDIKSLNTELDDLMEQSKKLNVKLVKCPNCGTVYDAEGGHTDA